MLKSFYFLRKSKKIFRLCDRVYQKKIKGLSFHERERISSKIVCLKKAIKERDSSKAWELAQDLSQESTLARNSFERIRDSVFSIGIALVFAVVIRTMWFELYTIPSGSMRPTLKESDVLLVSKTDFGLNVPLKSSHFTFDPDLVQRGSIVVWGTGEMDIPDSDTRYFGIFPGKKIFVKRLIGKPGDTLYFYGGKVYGINRKGDEIVDNGSIEHIPFIQFSGKVDTTPHRGGVTATFRQMDLPIATLSSNSYGFVSGQLLPQAGGRSMSHYSDFMGMKNYAMGRLLSGKELQSIHPTHQRDSNCDLYLELTHHPSIVDAKISSDEMGRIRPDLSLSCSIIPLKNEHIKKIAAKMTTARFYVKNGKAFRLGFEEKHPFYSNHYPHLKDVPDGMYEFQDGTAFKVYPLGYTKELEKNHPLYSLEPVFVQTLYNLGIEFLNFYNPEKNLKLLPSRYAYFRDGSLYLLGAPILEKGDPVLAQFFEIEEMKAKISTPSRPYIPFKDMGPPTLDIIRKFGVKVPEKNYLMLGDNHAMSADSRQFGFVPEDNLKGSVSFLLSPFGERWGRPIQPPMKYFGFPNLFVWTTAVILTLGYKIVRKRKAKEPLGESS